MLQAAARKAAAVQRSSFFSLLRVKDVLVPQATAAEPLSDDAVARVKEDISQSADALIEAHKPLLPPACERAPAHLQMAALPRALQSIETDAFAGCLQLQLQRGLPAGLLRLGERAFENCARLLLAQPGGVAALLMNQRNEASSVMMPNYTSAASVWQLTAPDTGSSLWGHAALCNGRLLRNVRDLLPRALPAHDSVVFALPAMSLVFVTFPNAGVRACL